MSTCYQCGSIVPAGTPVCRTCGEPQTTQPASTTSVVSARRRRVADSSSTPHGEVEPQRITVEVNEPTVLVAASTLDQLSLAPKTTRRTVLRVSPFVFFLAPMLAFYVSAVLASYTLHFGSGGGTCPDSLRTFLWGAILAGYVFVLGFALMLVGPRVDSRTAKWAAIGVFVVLLGILTGKGARQLISNDNTNECTSSSWYRTCWVITGFYCLFWLFLAILVVYEVFHACCFPSSPEERVVVLGVGAEWSQWKLPAQAKNALEVFKHKFPMPDALARATKKSGSSGVAGVGPISEGEILDARRQAEVELALLDDPTRGAMAREPLASPSQTDVRKDNFFGSSATEKRRGSQRESALEDPPAASRPPSILRIKSTSVAPSPVESEDEAADEKRAWPAPPSTTAATLAGGGLAGGKSFQAQSRRQPVEATAADSSREHSQAGDASEEDDPFQAKIEANKRAQEQRRKELAEITRATEAMAQQRSEQQPAPPFVSLPPLSTTSGGPAGILRAPSNAGGGGDRFKMVEFHHGARLEEVKHIRPEEDEQSRMGDSFGSDTAGGWTGQSPMQQQQQQQQPDPNRSAVSAPPAPRFLPPLAEYRPMPEPIAPSPYSYAPLPPPPSSSSLQQAQLSGPQTPLNPAYVYSHIPAGSPVSSPAPYQMQQFPPTQPVPSFGPNYSTIPPSPGFPAPSASSYPPQAQLPVPTMGPIYPERPSATVAAGTLGAGRVDPNDPNRFCKLMQERNAHMQQQAPTQPMQQQRVWPPPPPPQQVPAQPQQQMQPANPSRYNTIEDDLSF